MMGLTLGGPAMVRRGTTRTELRCVEIPCEKIALRRTHESKSATRRRVAQWLSTESPLFLEEPDHGLMECRLVWRGAGVGFACGGRGGWRHAEKATHGLVRRG